MSDPTAGLFHLRGGWYFGREGDQVVVAHKRAAVEISGIEVVELNRLPLNEWASVVAATMPGGETAETFQAALDLLQGDL